MGLSSDEKTCLEQKHILSAVGSMDCQLAWPLLAGDDVQLGRKGCNGHKRRVGDIGARHRQLQILWQQKPSYSLMSITRHALSKLV